ncbi:MAG: BON domain-containing protein, partial [Vicinamibacterales bacterium]
MLKASALALSLALAGTPALAASDAQLARRIEGRLTKAGFDQRGDIAVDVESGTARLTGIVLRWADVREADKVARKEVKSVVNLLRVVPENPRSDADVRADVEKAVLRWERYGPFDAVGIEVRDGVVSLGGFVEDPWKRGQIEERLTRIDAIRDVINNLRVQGFSGNDVSLRTEVFTKIYGDPMFERFAHQIDKPVRVYVERGRVTLVGMVGSRLEQQTVGHIARATLAFSV